MIHTELIGATCSHIDQRDMTLTVALFPFDVAMVRPRIRLVEVVDFEDEACGGV